MFFLKDIVVNERSTVKSNFHFWTDIFYKNAVFTHAAKEEVACVGFDANVHIDSAFIC